MAVSSSNYNLIREAILDKMQVIATYDGFLREMCPHAIGHKIGSGDHVLVYQFAGGSKRGLQPLGSTQNWRCMDVEKITDISVREGEWHSYSKHRGRQTCIDIIDVKVSD